MSSPPSPVPPTKFPDNPRLILASSSPYRRELLQRLHLPFEIMVPDIDESSLKDELPQATAMRLSEAKARKVAQSVEHALIIGSDQVASCNQKPFGKPGNHAAAFEQLCYMRKQLVEFHTGICLYDTRLQSCKTACVVTHVRFRDLEEAEIHAYLEIERPYDVAGSARVEGLGITLLDAVKSEDPTALIGLPLITLTRFLREAGVSIFTRGK